MKLAAFALVTLCGGGSKPPPADPAPYIERMREFADRCDECKAVRDCLQPLRDEWEAAKQPLLDVQKRLTGEPKTAFDTQGNRLKICGDGGGVTFWVDQ